MYAGDMPEDLEEVSFGGSWSCFFEGDEITWSSDYMVTNQGWEICYGEGPEDESCSCRLSHFLRFFVGKLLKKVSKK